MSETPIVSICSPCYNVAPYIGRYLDSLLSQTYKKLEIILVNDGATDDTDSIIRSYIPRLEEQGFIVKYLIQRNGGQSAAMNNALKHVTGKYMCWPDPDDWMTPNAVEARVQFMEQHPEVAMVRGELDNIRESTGERVSRYEMECDGPVVVPNAMEFCVMGGSRDWYHTPLAYMVRTSVIDEVIPGREIYVTKRGGQNWQIYIPVLAKYDCWHIPVCVGYYLLRGDSHFRQSQKSILKRICYMCVSEDVLLHSLAAAGTEVLDRFESRVIEKYDNLRQEIFDKAIQNAAPKTPAKQNNKHIAEATTKGIQIGVKYNKARKQYKKVRLLSHILWGDKAKQYKEQKKDLQKQIQTIEKAIQQSQD